MSNTVSLHRHRRSDHGWLTRRLLQLACDRSGVPLAAFAEAVNQRVGGRAITPAILEEWKRGAGQPPADVWVAALLAAGADMAPVVESLTSAGAMGDTLEDDVNRRRFLAALVSLAGLAGIGGGDLERWERLARVMDAKANLTGGLLDDLHGVVRGLARECWGLPPQRLLPVIDSQIVVLRELLRRPGPGSLQRRLQCVAADAAVLAAWLAFLLENRGDAYAYSREAEELAVEAGEGPLRAHALVIRSDLYSSIAHGGVGGVPSAAIGLLDEAERAAGPGGSAYLHAWLLACRAECHATAGLDHAARRDLDVAARALSTAGDRDDGFFAPWDEARLAGFRGSCALTLRQPGEAVTILEQALKDTPPAFTERPAVLTDLAAARAQQGEVEQACDLLAESLTLALNAGMAGHVQRVMGARRHLEAWRTTAAVRRLDEQLLAIL